MGDEEKQKMKNEKEIRETPAKQERILKQGKSPSTRQRIFNPLAAGLTFGSAFLGAAQGPRAAEQKMATDAAARNSLRNRPEMVSVSELQQIPISASISLEHFEVAREPIQNLIEGIRTENQDNQEVLDLLTSGLNNGQVTLGVEDFSEAGVQATSALFGLENDQEVMSRLEAIYNNFQALNQGEEKVRLQANLFFEEGAETPTPSNLSFYLLITAESGLTTPNGETLSQGSVIAFNEGESENMRVYPAVGRGRIVEVPANTIVGERTLREVFVSSFGNQEFSVSEEAPYFLLEIDKDGNIVQFWYLRTDGQTGSVALQAGDLPFVELATATPAPGEEKELVILVKAVVISGERTGDNATVANPGIINPSVLESVPSSIQSQFSASAEYGGRFQRQTGDETQLWSSRLGESQLGNLEAGWTKVLDTVTTPNMGSITSEILASEDWNQRSSPSIFEGFSDEAINQGLIENGIRQFWVETLTGIGGSTLEYVAWDHVLSIEEANAMLDDTENWPAIIVPIQVVDDYYHPRVDKARSIDAYDEAHPENPASHIDYVDIRQGVSIIQHSAMSRVQMQGEQQPDRSWMVLLTGYDAGGPVAEPASTMGASVSPNGRLEIHLFNAAGIRNYDQNFVAYVPYYYATWFLSALSEVASQINLSPHVVPDVDRFPTNYWPISNAFGMGSNLQETNEAWVNLTLPKLFDIHD